MTLADGPKGITSPLAPVVPSGDADRIRQTEKSKQGRGINFKGVMRALEAEGIENPLQSIIAALKSPNLNVKEKMMVELELLQYIQPKLKAVEHSGKVELTEDETAARLKYLMSKADSGPGSL
jgi:hypothetical protein